MSTLLLGYDAVGGPIWLSPENRRTHMHVIGSSGSGKSKFLEWMIRGDLQNRQGLCLIDPHGELYNAVLAYAAHHALRRKIILLNPSAGEPVIGFNPFCRVKTADVSVQVDRRIIATLHAWNVKTPDQTPTLERTLRLIYTVMIEQDLALPQMQHLLDFDAQEVRDHLVAKLQNPLIQREWHELRKLRAKDWRDEILSAKNRLFRFLCSQSLTRFMGLSGRPLDLISVMNTGAILLVNLKPSDQLSHENARVFGALLVNELFEAAVRRAEYSGGGKIPAFYLYIDEFQNFVSLDIADMLDQVRKFGLFAVLAHQRFGQLDENVIDAALTNCRIKAVFGGLPVLNARQMAEELFIRELDPQRIKVAIYQTKFWPTYTRDKVYTKGRAHGSSFGYSTNSTTGSQSGSASGNFFQPGDWFGTELAGTSSVSSFGSSQMSGFGSTEGESHADSESVADIPILLPVPFKELSSMQFYSPEEQLLELTAALKEQYPRHCFIKIHNEKTQPMLVPMVQDYYTPARNRASYEQKLFTQHQALSAAEADRLIAAQEHALLQASDDSGHHPISVTSEFEAPQCSSSQNPFEIIVDTLKKQKP